MCRVVELKECKCYIKVFYLNFMVRLCTLLFKLTKKTGCHWMSINILKIGRSSLVMVALGKRVKIVIDYQYTVLLSREFSKNTIYRHKNFSVKTMPKYL